MEAAGGTFFGQTVQAAGGDAPASAIESVAADNASIPSATAPAVAVTATRYPSPLVVVAGLLGLLYLLH
jgi:hypothetical protein